MKPNHRYNTEILPHHDTYRQKIKIGLALLDAKIIWLKRPFKK